MPLRYSLTFIYDNVRYKALYILYTCITIILRWFIFYHRIFFFKYSPLIIIHLRNDA